jgi:hypothetical protein
MAEFSDQLGSLSEGVSLSIKVRVSSGCYHREHSPSAYAQLDHYLASHPIDRQTTRFVEHESGPELLLYLAIATAGLTLTKSVIDLITAVIKARSDGVKKGDHPREPLELIVRRVQKDGDYQEEIVLRIEADTVISKDVVKKAIDAVLQRLPEHRADENSKPPKRRKKS